MNALTYLTRKCPRDCDYCKIKDNGPKEEMSPRLWIEAFKILKKMGVDFNLIQGNEPWILGEDLITIMKGHDIPYALYSTAPAKLFDKYHRMFYENGIDSLACGVDWPLWWLNTIKLDKMDDTMKKSVDGWTALIYTKKFFPQVDCGPTFTMHNQNICFFWDFLKDAEYYDLTFGVNFINWDKDGGYDFCATKEEIPNLIFNPEDGDTMMWLDDFLEFIRIDPRAKRIHNYDSLQTTTKKQILDMKWHCFGDPYGGPTIDSDGTLRCCGYRKGDRTPKFHILELKTKYAIREWKKAVYQDAFECPGCIWSCPMMYNYYEDQEVGSSKKMFSNHANSTTKGVKRCVA